MESKVVRTHRHNLAKWLQELEAMPQETLNEKDLSTMQMLQKMKESHAPIDEFSKKMGGRGTYYDKEGKPMTHWEWSGYLSDLEYKIVKQDQFGPFFVSTVWLGMDHGYSCFTPEGEPYFPVIFETMIFDRREEESGVEQTEDELHLWQDRYSFESQARQGHEVACELAAEKAWKIYQGKGSRLQNDTDSATESQKPESKS